jgi:copper chaperone CopZ
VVQRALAGLPGVQQVEVNFTEGSVRLAYNPAEVTVAQMVQAVHQAGFSARAASASGR